ncbi:MAG TPA: dTDP-glucose 4,6-dehydratase [Flexilinea sp.]|nr:dTDP-glucose 4,6-dehydratase [Flexilinea sp.]
MKNVLVTGGAGFIGSNFVRYLLQREPDVKVVTLDLLTYAGKTENLEDLPHPENHVFVQGDICDRELVDQLLVEHAIDTIVHFAAESHVDRSILGPMPFIQTNIIGTFTLLEAAKNAWKDKPGEFRFHHISTDEVFGALHSDDPAFEEGTPYNPHSPYSASKASSDHLVRAYYSTYNLPITISNCSNNYGPYQFPEKLIPLMILNGITGKPLPVYGKGEQIRDWLHVMDHCEAIYLILKKGKIGETYCIGGDNQPTNLEIVQLICEILDDKVPRADGKSHTSQIQYVSDRPGHDFRYDINTNKIQRELGWKPAHALRTGLEETIEWYLNHSAWVDSVLDKDEFSSWINTNYQERDSSF